jgi:hypothetical protein
MGGAARWLVSLGVAHVAMEATGIYSMPAYYALLQHGGGWPLRNSPIWTAWTPS